MNKNNGLLLEEDDDQLIITLTRKCNLRCSYCYQFDKNGSSILIDRNSKHMDWETLKTSIEKYPEKKFVRFFGGEPLIRSDLIEKAIDYFGDSRKWGITTNCLLHNKLKERYWKKFSSIKISLDGISNKKRANKDDELLSSVGCILDKVLDLSCVVVSMTMTNEYHDYSLLSRVLDIYNKFNIKMFEVGIDSFIITNSIENEKIVNLFINEIFDTYKYIASNDFFIAVALRDQLTANLNNNINCSMLSGEYISIDVDGTIDKCHVGSSLGFDLSEYNLQNTKAACPLLKKINNNLGIVVDNYTNHLNELVLMEDILIEEFKKRVI